MWKIRSSTLVLLRLFFLSALIFFFDLAYYFFWGLIFSVSRSSRPCSLIDLSKLGFRLSSFKSTVWSFSLKSTSSSSSSSSLWLAPRFAAAAAAASRVHRSKTALTSQLCSSLSSPCFGSSHLSLPPHL